MFESVRFRPPRTRKLQNEPTVGARSPPSRAWAEDCGWHSARTAARTPAPAHVCVVELRADLPECAGTSHLSLVQFRTAKSGIPGWRGHRVCVEFGVEGSPEPR